MPKREKKEVEQERRKLEEAALERELMLAPVTETPAQTRASEPRPETAAVGSRWRAIDKNGFAVPKPDRRWLH